MSNRFIFFSLLFFSFLLFDGAKCTILNIVTSTTTTVPPPPLLLTYQQGNTFNHFELSNAISFVAHALLLKPSKGFQTKVLGGQTLSPLGLATRLLSVFKCILIMFAVCFPMMLNFHTLPSQSGAIKQPKHPACSSQLDPMI